MLSNVEIKKLSQMEHLDCPMVSCYFNLESDVTWKRNLNIQVKDAMHSVKEQAGRLNTSQENENFLNQDIEKIKEYFADYERNGERSVALFSQAKNNFFAAYSLYSPIHNRTVVDYDIYLGPIINSMQQHHRYCVIALSQKKARIFEFFMGNLEYRMEIMELIPKRVKAGGFHGYEGKRIERHAQEGIHHHFKVVGDRAMDVFRRYRFDDLILMGEKKTLSEFEAGLHSYLKERLIGRLNLRPESSLKTIKKLTQEMELKVKRSRDKRMVTQLETSTYKQSLGMLGLEGTLEALGHGNVKQLILHEDFNAMGLMCSDCSVLRGEGSLCPHCRKPLTPIKDIVNQAIEEALHQKAQVWYIDNDIEFPDKIGALLRYPIAA